MNCQCFGRYRRLRSRRCFQAAELMLNLLVYFNDQLPIVVKCGKRLSERKQVLWSVITLERLRYRIFTALYASMAEECGLFR